MNTLRRLRPPSPAMVVALLALLVALGGTSIAAVTALPNNSVGTPQLKGNAVISSKVKNKTLLAADFAPGQIPAGPQGETGPAGPAGPAGVASPGYVAQVLSQTSASYFSTKSTSYVDLDGSTQGVTVPTGETARLYVWFTAESTCYGGPGYCSVRIVVDGNDLEPTSFDAYEFDSSDFGNETLDSSESHAMVRVSNTLSAGPHTVKVQVLTQSSSPPTTMRLHDWALVIQRTKLS